MTVFLEYLGLFVLMPAFVGWGLCKFFQPRNEVIQSAFAIVAAAVPCLAVMLLATTADSITGAAAFSVAPAFILLCLIPAGIGCAVGRPKKR